MNAGCSKIMVSEKWEDNVADFLTPYKVNYAKQIMMQDSVGVGKDGGIV